MGKAEGGGDLTVEGSLKDSPPYPMHPRIPLTHLRPETAWDGVLVFQDSESKCDPSAFLRGESIGTLAEPEIIGQIASFRRPPQSRNMGF